MDSNSQEIIVYYIFGSLIGLLITYYLIRSATFSKERLSEAKRQTALLNEIAKASGVNPDTVDVLHKIQDKADNA